MKLLGIFAALLVPFLIAGALSVSAAQPKEDSVVLDKDGCTVDLSWVDGLEVAQKVTLSFDGIVKNTYMLDDIVGDQSAILATVTAPEGTALRARLYVDNEVADEATTTISKCPTATPTSVATSTPVPATSTPQPTATVPPVPTPIVIVQTVEVPVKITAPSTGDGGLR
jgi:hypothetical protein